MILTVRDLERWTELDATATPGPWEWFGNTSVQEIYLATTGGGRRVVMDFERWGMRNAQPRFQLTVDGTAADDGIMWAIGELGKREHALGPRFEVPYRRQFVGVGHPDARFLAEARTIVPTLLAELARLRQVIADAASALECHTDKSARAAFAAVFRERALPGSAP